MEAYDFSGWATKSDVKCSDGRTIGRDAFRHMDGEQIPLVWQHGHSDAENVLGHVKLEARDEGVYAYGFFNGTSKAQHIAAAVQHGDITRLSIFANALKEHSKRVLHGIIREVSLVMAGANPQAMIDYVAIRHSDDPNDIEISDEAAVIHTGLEFEEIGFWESDADEVTHADGSGKTVQDVYNTLTEEQKTVVHFIIGEALDSKPAEHSATGENQLGGAPDKSKEGTDVTHSNVFEQNAARETGATGKGGRERHALSHDAMKGILANAKKLGTLKEALAAYADEHLQHGIDDIDLLFPDARNTNMTPEFIKRRTEWVDRVLNGTSHTPWSRVKTIWADITADKARALGYVKGTFKKTEWFGLAKRTTTPATVYKKQQLDRDDILDITDMDVVAWLKAEMRVMLKEELARAILIGDGREADDPDKIKDPIAASSGEGIRSIYNDHELFAATLYVNVDDANSSYEEVIETLLRNRHLYKGTGTPDFYTTTQVVAEMLLCKDTNGRRYYLSKEDLKTALMVNDIIEVEVMSQVPDLLGIFVNLTDYSIGTDRGGEVNSFEDFDIDYNQYKYLMETRLSGGLTKIRSALLVKKTAAANVLVVPTTPTFVKSTGVVTIPTKTGVTYHWDTAGGATLSAGAQTALAAGATRVVVATANSNYYFSNNAEDQWSFTRDDA